MSDDEIRNIALLRANIEGIKKADIFYDLQDIQFLEKLENWYNEALKDLLRRGVIESDPYDSLLERVQKVIGLFAQGNETLDHIKNYLGSVVLSHDSDFYDDPDTYLEQFDKEIDGFESTLNLLGEKLSPADWLNEGELKPFIYEFAYLVCGEMDFSKQVIHEFYELIKRRGDGYRSIKNNYDHLKSLLIEKSKGYREEKLLVDKALSEAKRGDFQTAFDTRSQLSKEYSRLPYNDLDVEIAAWEERLKAHFSFYSIFLKDNNRKWRSSQRKDSLRILDVKLYVKQVVANRFNPFSISQARSYWSLVIQGLKSEVQEEWNKDASLEKSEFKTKVDETFQQIILEVNDLGDAFERTFTRTKRLLSFGWLGAFLCLAIVCCGYYVYSLVPKTGVAIINNALLFETIEVYDSSGKKIDISDKKVEEESKVLLRGLWPGEYEIRLGKKNRFPAYFHRKITFGEIVDLSDDVIEYAEQFRSTRLRITIPSGGNLRVESLDEAAQFGEFVFEPRTLTRGDTAVKALAITSNASIMASGHSNGIIKIWDVDKGKLIHEITEHKESVDSLAFNETGDFLASGSSDQSVQVWDLRDYKRTAYLGNQQGGVEQIAFSQGERNLLAIAVGNDTVKLWDLTQMRVVQKLKVKSQQENADWGLAKETFKGESPAVKLSVMMNLNLPAQGLHRAVESITFTPNGAQLVAGLSDGGIVIWDLTGKKDVEDDLSRLTQKLTDLEKNGAQIASNSVRKSSILDSFEDEDVVSMISALKRKAQESDQNKLDTSRKLISDRIEEIKAEISEKKDLFRRYKPYREIVAHENAILDVKISPDGRLLASASSDGSVKLWNFENYKELFSWRDFEGTVESIQFNHNGNRLLVASFNGYLSKWDTHSGNLVEQLKAHDSAIFAVLADPNGDFIATGSMDASIKLWDVVASKDIQIQPGRYRLIGSKKGYSAFKKEITIKRGALLPISIQLKELKSIEGGIKTYWGSSND